MMQIPGSNLFSFAQQVFGDTDLVWLQANGRTLNAVGQFITTYNEPIIIEGGNWQPVSRMLYEKYGLDQSKDYYVYYVPVELIDVQRDRADDLLVLGSQTFQCEAADPDWFAIDGWMAMLCCLIHGEQNPEGFEIVTQSGLGMTTQSGEKFVTQQVIIEDGISNINHLKNKKPKIISKRKIITHNASGLFKNVR